jgi:hypothetical protein
MREALNLRHLAEVWRPEGPLQASLAVALGLRKDRTPIKRLSRAERRARAEARIERAIAKLDGLDGDHDLELEPVEVDSDFEPSVA